MSGELITLSDARVLAIATGVAWSGLIALARRAALGLEKKIDDNARKVAELQSQMAVMVGDTKYRIERNFRDLVDESRGDIKELSARLEAAGAAHRADMDRLRGERAALIRERTVSRGEFRLFAANLNTKVESIYNIIMKNGANG